MTIALTQPQADAIALLRAHPSVVNIGTPEKLQDGCVQVELAISVELPSRAKSIGVSSSGVKAIEPVLVGFGRDWPLRAPTILLRKDFPLHFPHINPYKTGNNVSPCIYQGSVSELMHLEGLDKVIDQLVDWLEKAAANNLINREQGWEPTRRDDLAGEMVFDAEKFVTLLPDDGAILRFAGRYIGFNKHHHLLVSSIPDNRNQYWFVVETENNKLGNWTRGQTCTFLACSPNKNGIPNVVATYEPESVETLNDLVQRADRLGINGEALFKKAEDYLLGSQKAGKTYSWQEPFIMGLVLAVHRPLPLISAYGRSVEFLPYIVSYFPLNSTKFRTHAKVEPAWHQQRVTPKLLTAVSGTKNTSQPITILGVGSIGSKISMHLGRAGFGNQVVIDDDIFSPHNVARHALVENPAHMIFPLKTMLMENALQQLGHAEAVGIFSNALPILDQKNHFIKVISDSSLIIDATASLTVAEAVCSSQALSGRQGRYLRVAMFGDGAVCYVALEGVNRSVRVDDLFGALFSQCRLDVELRGRMAGKSDGPDRVFIGQNCSSATTIMTDSTVSRAAATATLQIERWLESEFPADGVLGIASEDTFGIGMYWQAKTLLPTKVIHTASDGGWEVRVLNSVYEAIDSESKKYGKSETGGVLVGHIYQGRRCIVIADLVDAPPDSTRSSSKFVLGIDGLEKELIAVHRHTLGHLHFIGTWHSHPQGGQLSSTDFRTLKVIAEFGQGLPAVSLVWTPRELLCEVQTIH